MLVSAISSLNFGCGAMSNMILILSGVGLFVLNSVGVGMNLEYQCFNVTMWWYQI